jgi:hypothetical protein
MQIRLRRTPRYPLIATAKVTELLTDTQLEARTSDLSIVGCYLEMMNPFPSGTEVRLQIVHKDTAFTALGTVVHSQANMGMGITFTAVEPDQQRVLEKWLADQSRMES